MGLGGRVKLKEDDSEWNFHIYRGTNLAYDMLCDPISSDNEDKEGDKISSNHLVNQNKLTTIIDNF